MAKEWRLYYFLDQNHPMKPFNAFTLIGYSQCAPKLQIYSLKVLVSILLVPQGCLAPAIQPRQVAKQSLKSYQQMILAWCTINFESKNQIQGFLPKLELLNTG